MCVCVCVCVCEVKISKANVYLCAVDLYFWIVPFLELSS